MRDVEVESASGAFGQRVTIGPHSFLSDEPVSDGGVDAGPSPHEWLLTALGTCTSMTAQIYAQRKGWPLSSVHVQVSGERGEDAFVIQRRLRLVGDLTAEQRARIVEIAENCPVGRTLRATIRIETTLL